jgi:hypothetical protein
MQASEQAKIREMDTDELQQYYDGIDYSKTTAVEIVPIIKEIFRNHIQLTGRLPIIQFPCNS